ncbi:unnamed protein product [Dibothriocephalus latus]|uniref:Exportin-1/Importin-beta-like domain-containing protein n=1 Tax=Dibothriocephalus latus TaxID=60516 RepID=A0A3P7NSU7_DIBLA|nr:unnamed protein product [Dibothriocephalus latus]
MKLCAVKHFLLQGLEGFWQVFQSFYSDKLFESAVIFAPVDHLPVDCILDTCPISSEQARNGIIALARDLAGVAFSLNTKSSFQMFLDWFYPSCFTLFSRALELWPFDPQVLSPVLKLLTEVVHNRNGRLMFDATIPMGYLLLSEMAKILVSSGSQLLPYFAQVPKESIFSHKIKPLTRLINALRTTVAGNFANFAIFGLVGDESFEKAIELGAQLLMCVSDEELRSYTKLARAYFSLLECLTQDHMVLLSSLDATVLRRVFDAVVVGVDSLGKPVVCSLAVHLI